MQYPSLRQARPLAALVGALLALALPGGLLGAQQRDSTVRDTVFDARALPREVSQRASDVYAGAAVRSSEPLEIEAGRTVAGSVAAIRGPLTVAGHVAGDVLAVNAMVVLRPGARIDGDLLVVGGDVRGLGEARVGGEVRVYREPVDLGEIGGPAANAGDESGWWLRWESRRHAGSWIDFHVSAGAYNRLEGLPINVGPRLRHRMGERELRLDALGIVRTWSSLESNAGDVGYDIRAEMRSGMRSGVAIGARLMDVNAPVEGWQLSDREVGLASFVARRDYRDYYQRRGGGLHARAFAGPDAGLTLRYSDERWRNRPAGDPLTLFYGSRDWRPNPSFDEGRFHILTAEVRVDTRNDVEHPWAGWYVVTDVEHGRGNQTSLAYTPPVVREQASAGANAPAGNEPGSTRRYTRGLLDVRRYNRLGPESQLNLRLVLGGWLGGDPLPLQRRFSVDGPGALPGYGFRRHYGTELDKATCNSGSEPLPGMPALCERIALVQAEFRGDVYLPRSLVSRLIDSDGEASWVVFADAGRGWLLRDSAAEQEYGHGAFPPLHSFRSDVGLGLDFDRVGFFVAKALSGSSEPPVFFVRLQRRF